MLFLNFTKMVKCEEIDLERGKSCVDKAYLLIIPLEGNLFFPMNRECVVVDRNKHGKAIKKV